MKKILFSCIALGSLFLNSCSSDPCKDKSATTQCNNNGTLASNGSSCDCNCNVGYTGTDCSVTVASKLVNAAGYSAKDTLLKTGQAFNYTATISSSSVDPTKVIIGNFGGFGTTTSLEAYVTSNTTVETKTAQTIAGVTIPVGAKGTISSDYSSIRWVYSSTDATGTVVNNGTWAKK